MIGFGKFTNAKKFTVLTIRKLLFFLGIMSCLTKKDVFLCQIKWFRNVGRRHLGGCFT